MGASRQTLGTAMMLFGCSPVESSSDMTDAAVPDSSSGIEDPSSESTSARDDAAQPTSLDPSAGRYDSGADGDIDESTGQDVCADIGDACTSQGDCCPALGGHHVCVIVQDEASCHARCEDDGDCASGCCALLHGGDKACLDARACAHECMGLLAECDDGQPCCAGSLCTQGACMRACTEQAQCPTACCSDDGSCVDADACGDDSGCDDGEYRCGADVLFECDDDTWYGIDCDAACAERGFGRSTGCAWADLLESDACTCAA